MMARGLLVCFSKLCRSSVSLERGDIGTVETKMETSIVYRGYMGDDGE